MKTIGLALAAIIVPGLWGAVVALATGQWWPRRAGTAPVRAAESAAGGTGEYQI